MTDKTFLVVKKAQNGMIMTVMATFDVETKAQEWADNANQWYGPEHPLTPLTVIGDVLIEPKLFPVEFFGTGSDMWKSLTERREESPPAFDAEARFKELQLTHGTLPAKEIVRKERLFRELDEATTLSDLKNVVWEIIEAKL